MVAAPYLICAYQKKQKNISGHWHISQTSLKMKFCNGLPQFCRFIRCDTNHGVLFVPEGVFFATSYAWEPASECFISHLVYEYTALWGLYSLHHLAVQEGGFRCRLSWRALRFDPWERWRSRTPHVQGLCREGWGVVCAVVWRQRPVWETGWLGAIWQGWSAGLQKRG